MAQGQIANDSATYRISDGRGGTATAKINVTITGVNDAPVAVADTPPTSEDSATIVYGAGQ